MKVERHNVSAIANFEMFQKLASNQLVSLEKNWYPLWEKGKLNNLGPNTNSVLNSINGELLFCPDEGSKLVSDLLFHWKIMAQNYYALAYSIGEEIELNFKGTKIKSVGQKRSGYVDFDNWCKVFYVFTFLRNRVGQSIMFSATYEHFIYSELEHFKEEFKLFDLIKGMFDKDEDHGKLLAEVRKWCLPQIITSEKRMKYVEHLFLPVVDVIEALLIGDEDLLNERLYSGLLKHKEFYEVQELCNRAEGWVSWPMIAMSCLAYDKGMKIIVESEYIPKWMYMNDY